MNEESPENIAENEAMEEMQVFYRWLKQEYGLLSSRKAPSGSLAPGESPRDSSVGGSSGAVTLTSILRFTIRHCPRRSSQSREFIGFGMRSSPFN